MISRDRSRIVAQSEGCESVGIGHRERKVNLGPRRELELKYSLWGVVEKHLYFLFKGAKSIQRHQGLIKGIGSWMI